MDHSYFLEILQKYREGKATPEEERFLLSSYDAFESQPDITGLLPEAERARLGQQMHEGILRQIGEQQHVVRKQPFRWKVAAAILVLAGAAFAAFLLVNPGGKAPAIAAADQSVQPAGENNLIALPDGSTVLVSAGSRLHYPSTFDGLEKREVYLEGKALFTVEQQRGKPFVVHAGGLQTTVLGTTFEVVAPENGEVTVTVFKGRVRVDDEGHSLGELSANQQIVYNTEAKVSRQQPAVQTPSWQQGDLLFDDVSLQQAARLLEDRFGYTITIPDEGLRAQRFSATFLSHEPLGQALGSICAFNQAAYTLDSTKKTVIIYRP